MPIRPERRGLYPADWLAISARIRERAGNRCEWCGARNGAIGYRDEKGAFHELSPAELACLCQRCHNRHDAPIRAQHAAETRRRRLAMAGQERLL